MLFTKDKPLDEVLKSLEDEKNIFLVACNGCAESCGTGGEKAMLAMQAEVEKAGKKAAGTCVVDFLCNKVLVANRLGRQLEEIEKADSVIVLSCGIGVQSVAKVVSRPVHPSANTVFLGGIQGLWPSDERCAACGDCQLDYTGGICPITFCAKSMLNGPCGGTKDGKCEVAPEKECGWQMIYEKLEKIGKLDNLKKINKPRNHSLMVPDEDTRKTRFFDIED